MVHVVSLVATMAVWSCVYLGLRVVTLRSPEYVSRLVASVHALLAVCQGGFLCVEGLGSYQLGDDEQMGRRHTTLMSISTGYFLYDLLFCLWHGKETRLMILHHIYSVLLLMRLLLREEHATFSCCGLAAMEVTNPFLQIRWFIRSAGKGNTVYFYFVEGIFMASFIIIRGVLGTYITVHVLLSSRVDVESKILTAIMQMISLAFISNILKYIGTKYIRGTLLSPKLSITRHLIRNIDEQVSGQDIAVQASQQN